MSSAETEIGHPLFTGRQVEAFIPPCAIEIRTADDEQRVSRNPNPWRAPDARVFEQIGYESTGDGNMTVTCKGQSDCEGGSVIVDRHDILQNKMPATCQALGAICTARLKYYSDDAILRRHEDLDAPLPPGYDEELD